MGKHPILHYINEIKNKLGFGRTMTASGADVVDAVNRQSDQIGDLQTGLAYVENGDNATRKTYTAGEYIVWKGVLYKVTSAIPKDYPIAGHVGSFSEGISNKLSGELNAFKNVVNVGQAMSSVRLEGWADTTTTCILQFITHSNVIYEIWFGENGLIQFYKNGTNIWRVQGA